MQGSSGDERSNKKPKLIMENANLFRSNEIEICDWVLFKLNANEKSVANVVHDHFLGLVFGFKFIDDDGRSKQYKPNYSLIDTKKISSNRCPIYL